VSQTSSPPPEDDSSSPPAKPRRSKWRRVRIGLTALVVVLALALFLRSLWLPWALRPLLVNQADAAAFTLDFETLETDGWSYLELHGTSVQPKDEQALQQVTLAKLRVDFHLPSLWKQGLAGVHGVLLEELAVHTDLLGHQAQDTPSTEPSGLEALQEWWPQLPPIAVKDLLWRDNQQEQLRLEHMGLAQFLEAVDKRQLQLRGPNLNLSAQLALEGEDFLAGIQLQRLAWDPQWQSWMASTLPPDLHATARGQLRLRLPLAQPENLQLAIEQIAVEGQQAQANWIWKGRSAQELTSAWTVEQALASWSSELAFQCQDWPGFATAWGMALEAPSEFGALEQVKLQLAYADGKLRAPQALVHSSRLRADASLSEFTIALDQGQWRLGLPVLQLEVEAKEDFPLEDGRVLPAGHGQLALTTREDFVLGKVMPPLRLAMETFVWESADGKTWVRQEAPMELDWSTEALAISSWKLLTPAGSLALEADLPSAFSKDPAIEGQPWSASVQSDGFDLAALQTIPGVPALPLATGTLHGQLHLGGSQSAPTLEGHWTLRDLRPQPSAVPEGFPDQAEVELGFVWNQDGLVVESARYQDAVVSMNVAAHSGYHLPPIPELNRLQQDWQDIVFYADGEILASDQGWVRDWLPADAPLRDGTIALDFEMEGIASSLKAGVLLQAKGWQPQGDLAKQLPPGALDIQMDATWHQQDLMLSTTVLQESKELARLEGSIQNPLEENPALDFQFHTPNLEPDWLDWEGLASIRAHLTGSMQDLNLQASLEGAELRPIPKDEESALPAFDMDVGLEWNREGLHVREVRAAGPLVKASASATLGLGLQPTAFAETNFADLPFEATMEGQIDALSWLSTLPSLRRVQGRLGFEASADGTLGAPLWRGQLDLEEAALRVQDPGLPSIEDLEVHAAFGPDGIRLVDSRGELGAAPFQLAGTMERQADGLVHSDLRLSGEDLLLYRTSGIKIRADSELTVQGVWPKLQIGGDLAFTDSRVVQNIPLLRSPIGPPRPPTPGGLTLFRLAPPLDQLQFSVGLTSEEGIGLRSNLARGMLRPALRLEGTGAVPKLRGEVFLDKVSMTLPATRLYLQPSVARFLEDDPFHPQLNLFGRASLQGFDVQVVVTGPYDQPKVLLSSTPPLQEQDIILLLTTGQPPANRLDRRAAAGTAALYLARDFLTTFFGSDSVDAEESLLDRLEINFGRDQTRNGAETLSGRLRLRDEVWRENDSLYLEGGRDAFEDYFLGLEWLLRFR